MELTEPQCAGDEDTRDWTKGSYGHSLKVELSIQALEHQEGNQTVGLTTILLAHCLVGLSVLSFYL